MVLTFTKSMSKPWERLRKFLWPSQKSWTLGQKSPLIVERHQWTFPIHYTKQFSKLQYSQCFFSWPFEMTKLSLTCAAFPTKFRNSILLHLVFFSCMSNSTRDFWSFQLANLKRIDWHLSSDTSAYIIRIPNFKKVWG